MDIIEYQEDTQLHAENMGQMQKLSMRKRKKIIITTDCTCDIPSELLEKYDQIKEFISEDEFLNEMQASFQHKFAKTPEVIDGNMMALELAFEEVG